MPWRLRNIVHRVQFRPSFYPVQRIKDVRSSSLTAKFNPSSAERPEYRIHGGRACQQHTKNLSFIHAEITADAGRGVLHSLFPPASDLHKSVVRTTSGVVAGDSVAHSSKLNHKSTRTRDGNKNSPSCFDGCSVETLRQGIMR